MVDDSLVPAGDGIEITTLGLNVQGNLAFDDWQDLGYTLCSLRRAMTWCIGDWLNYGEFRYGEMYAQGEAVTGMNPDYLRNLKWIASRIPMSLRRDNRGLSWHQPVASLETEAERKFWLELADRQDWTRAELRAQINGSTQITASSETALIAPISNETLRTLIVSYIRAKNAGNQELAASAWKSICEGLKDEL